jgi:hypothetical protein
MAWASAQLLGYLQPNIGGFQTQQAIKKLSVRRKKPSRRPLTQAKKTSESLPHTYTGAAVTRSLKFARLGRLVKWPR